MKKNFTVLWAGPAKHDLFEIAEYIADDNSPAVALKIIEKLSKKVSDLHVNPERGRVVPELSKQGMTKFRELVVSPWRVIYEIDGTDIFVLIVADGRRNLEDLLFKRLLR